MGNGSRISFASRNIYGQNRCHGCILAWGLDSETRFQQIPDFDHSSTHDPILASLPARCCLIDMSKSDWSSVIRLALKMLGVALRSFYFQALL